MPPFALAAMRFFFAAVPLVFFIRRPRMPWRFVVAYGFAIGVCQFGLLFLGMKLGMPAGLSSLVIQVQVFFTIGLGIAFLGDRLHRAERRRRGDRRGRHRAARRLQAAGRRDGDASASCWCWSRRSRGRSATSSPSAPPATTSADMFALVVWSSLVPPLPLAVLSYLFEGGTGVMGTRSRHASWLAWGMRAVPGVGRDAVRLRVMGAAAAPLPDGADLAVRAADPGVGTGQRRAVPGRVARRDAVAGVLLVFAGLAVNVYGAQVKAWMAG